MSERTPSVRKAMPSPRLDEATFRARFLSRFADPAFGPLAGELDRIAGAAWDAYSHGRKLRQVAARGP